MLKVVKIDLGFIKIYRGKKTQVDVISIKLMLSKMLQIPYPSSAAWDYISLLTIEAHQFQENTSLHLICP